MNKVQSKLPAIMLCFIFVFITRSSFAQQTETNYDESKVPTYTLPSLLISQKGLEITSAKEWEHTRRKEILHLFEEQVYGKMPNKKIPIRFEITGTSVKALNGKATRKEITAHFGTNVNAPKMYILLYIPNERTKPAPAFVGFNFYGNHTIWNDPEISLARSWVSNNSNFSRF